MIYINGEVVTSIEVNKGDFIEGYVESPNVVSTPLPTIEGDYITDYVIQDIKPFEGFYFGFTVGRTFEDYTKVTFTYYGTDKTAYTETLELNQNTQHTVGYIQFANRTNISVISGLPASGQTLQQGLMLSEVATPIQVESTVGWLSGVVNGSTLNVTIGKNTTTLERDGKLTLTATDYLGNELKAYSIVMQYPATTAEPSTFRLSSDRVEIPALVDNGIVAYQIPPIRTVQTNILFWDVVTESDFFNVIKNGTEIQINGVHNNETPFEKRGSFNVYGYGSDNKDYFFTVNVKQEGSKENGNITFVGGNQYRVTPNANATAEVIMQLTNIFDSTVYISYDSSYDDYLNITKFENSYIISTKYYNNTIDDKEYFFTVYGTDYSNQQVSASFKLIHSATVNGEELPIWRTELVEYETAQEYIDYKLVLEDGKVIYNGRAYSKEGAVELELNSLVKHYLNETLDIDYEGWQDNNAYITVNLVIDGSLYKKYFIYNDWCYEENHDSLISYPISNVLDYRQRFLVSAVNRVRDNEEDTIVSVRVDGKRDFNPQVLENQIMTKTITDLHNIDTIEVESNDSSLMYYVRCTNMPYSLYYLNKCGGYDTMLFNGASLKSDTITNSEYTTNQFNMHKHSLIQYEKRIVQQWQLKSSILNDKQSELMNHLLTSPQIWLHDLEKDEIVPVVINDTTAQYKLRSNNARKPIQYTLTVKSSKVNYRR